MQYAAGSVSGGRGGRTAGLRLRPAGAADEPAILAINREGRPGVGPLVAEDIGRFLEIATFFRVAEGAEGVAAYLIGLASDAAYDSEEFLWFKERHPEFLYVDQIAVAARARGQGAASALYAELERFASARGVPLLTLEVNLRPENRPSLGFHDHHGFTEAGRLETADGRLVSLRVKRIAPVV